MPKTKMGKQQESPIVDGENFFCPLLAPTEFLKDKAQLPKRGNIPKGICIKGQNKLRGPMVPTAG